VWIFIAGDIVTFSAIVFAYLYLRGVNTGGHWMSVLGNTVNEYNSSMASGADLPAAHLIHISVMSATKTWIVAGIATLSALGLWRAEHSLREGRGSTRFLVQAGVSTLLAGVLVALSSDQLGSLERVYATANDSAGFVYSTYSSMMMLIIGVALVHFFLLAFLGLGLVIRAARGVVSTQKWFQVRLVRLFWVWTAISVVLMAALTTTVNTVH
jgi:heme/copper-type cytochrome/quinol oxidase subunit 3